MTALQTITVATPDGDFHLIIDAGQVVRASGFGPLSILRQRLPDEVQHLPIHMATDHSYEGYVREYYGGDSLALARIPCQQTGSDFQIKVWAVIRAVPYGATISYKQLALAAQNPAAMRAAGTICGLNRLILLVPCHRVVKSDGGIGSYLYGTPLKRALLARERGSTR